MNQLTCRETKKEHDYDEFPYASTEQGGKAEHVEEHVEGVVSTENQAAGREQKTPPTLNAPPRIAFYIASRRAAESLADSTLAVAHPSCFVCGAATPFVSGVRDVGAAEAAKNKYKKQSYKLVFAVYFFSGFNSHSTLTITQRPFQRARCR